MKEAKIAIIEDNPQKLEKYKRTVTRYGHKVVAEVTSLAKVPDFLDHFSDTPESTPDVVLVDGILDEERIERLSREGKEIELDGDWVVSVLKKRKTEAFKDEVIRSQTVKETSNQEFAALLRGVLDGTVSTEEPHIKIPKGQIVPEHVRTIGISSAFPLEGADVPNASPGEVISYIESIGSL